MNQRPFISTQLNIFDDNRCVFSSSSIGGQPVMISQEQNRKICDSLTTSIASNRPPLNSYCAGPPPSLYHNQPQIWSCPVQAQRQGVPGGVVFNFGQPNYSCPPSCLPSVYNPPPPPTPQLIENPCKTPQSICVDFGRYGMEAMAFQQKCRQLQGFTYDKQVGTADQIVFPKNDTCCCGVQSSTLNAEQKEQLFHRVDGVCAELQLKDTACETDKRKCICFPKPDPNKFGSAKTLVINERKEKSCREYDIVEKAEIEADAEAYLCCDCLDKWKKQNENNKPSCLKKKSVSSTENDNGLRDVSIAFSENALEITEEKQIHPKSNGQYNVQKLALKDTSGRVRRKKSKNEIEQHLNRPEKVIRGFENLKKNLCDLQADFQQNVKNIELYINKDIEFYTKLFDIEEKEIDRQQKEEKEKLRSNMNAMAKLPEPLFKRALSEVFNDSLDLFDTLEEKAKRIEARKTKEKDEKRNDRKASLDSEETVTKINKNNQQRPTDSKPSTVAKSEKVFTGSNDFEPKSGSNKTDTDSKDQFQRLSDPLVKKTEPINMEEIARNTNVEVSKDPTWSTEEDLSEPGPEIREEINSKDNKEKKSSLSEDPMREATNIEGSKNNASDSEAPKASTSHQDEPEPPRETESLVEPLSTGTEEDDHKNKQDDTNQNLKKAAGSVNRGESSFREDNQMSESTVTAKKTTNSCECNTEDDKNFEDRNRSGAFRSCTCGGNTLARFGGILSNFYSGTLERAGNFLSYITCGRSCVAAGQPFYENPRIITDRHGCYSDCYHTRIRRNLSDLDRPICSSRMSTNRFCGRTCYDRDRNMWYSYCHGFCEQKEVKITVRETSQRRTIRLEDSCRNTRYHVVYE